MIQALTMKTCSCFTKSGANVGPVGKRGPIKLNFARQYRPGNKLFRQ